MIITFHHTCATCSEFKTNLSIIGYTQLLTLLIKSIISFGRKVFLVNPWGLYGRENTRKLDFLQCCTCGSLFYFHIIIRSLSMVLGTKLWFMLFLSPSVTNSPTIKELYFHSNLERLFQLETILMKQQNSSIIFAVLQSVSH